MNHAGIKMVAGLFAAIVLSSCAATDATPGNDKEQAIRDFVAVRQLAEIDRIRTDRNDSYQELDPHFLIYKARKKEFLVEFARACYELEETIPVADRRYDASNIYARFDTIRGCRIHKIFALTEAELAELDAIGESPGSRN